MYTMHNICAVLAYLFRGEAPSRWAIIRATGRPSTRYGYPAVHRTIRHGYAAYAADGKAVVLTEKGREYLGLA